jgi:anti-anti-sigma factor
MAVKELKIDHETMSSAGAAKSKSKFCVSKVTWMPILLTDFEEELTKLVEGGHYNLLLDLEKLTYINSTGLGLLMATFRQVRQQGGDLVIAKMSDKITNIFNLLGFSRLIHTYPTEEEALGKFAVEPA